MAPTLLGLTPGIRQHLLSAAAASAAAAAATKRHRSGGPDSSSGRDSPIDVDDTGSEGGPVSPPSGGPFKAAMSGHFGSAFRQVKPNLKLQRRSPDKDTKTSDKKDKHVWRPY